jgi:hypothetical protein
MAKRASRGAQRGAPARPPKATSRKAASKKDRAPAVAAAEVEIVEEAGGAGVETAIAIFTFLALVVAFLMIDKVLGTYDTGLFFKP